MKLLRISAESPDNKLVSLAAKAILDGKVIIYPTDTVYGLGCSISSAKSVKRVSDIKKRSADKPLSIAFPNIESARKYVFLDADDEEYIKKNINEPLTFIVRKNELVPGYVTAGMDTVGIRIPDNKIVKELLLLAGIPIITTSANLSGEKAPGTFQEISKEVLEKADLAIDSGPCRAKVPSKIVNLLTGEVLRGA
jgi:L-threonylcarbamoyladenylate synthase